MKDYTEFKEYIKTVDFGKIESDVKSKLNKHAENDNELKDDLY
jgi:hypothetical protein